jgi:hypothetical protein
MSIIETAKRNTLDVYGYLLYLLIILPELGNDPTEAQLEAIMPWSMTLPAYCRQMYHEICNERDFNKKMLKNFSGGEKNNNYIFKMLISRCIYSIIKVTKCTFTYNKKG